MFTAQSNWGEYVTAGHVLWLAAQAPLPMQEADCPYLLFCRSLGNHLTVIQGYSAFRGNIDFGHIVCAFMHTWHIVDVELRDELVELVAQNAVASVHVYSRHTGLTDAHDRQLWDAFSSALPRIAEGFISGVRQRAKPCR
jgi:hypothetical protein